MHQQRRVNVDKEGAHRQEQGDQQPDKPFFQAELVRDKAEERLHQQGDKGVDRVKQPGLRGADAKMLGGPDNEESHGRRPGEQVEEIEKTQQKVVSFTGRHVSVPCKWAERISAIRGPRSLFS